jgi:IS4 transposase
MPTPNCIGCLVALGRGCLRHPRLRLLSLCSKQRQELNVAIPAIAAALQTLLKTLEKYSDWNRMREAPGRIDQLEARIAELERRLEQKRLL